MKNKRLILYGVLALLFTALDQLSKYLTDLYLSPVGTSYAFWPDVLHFTSVHNTGAAFGMFSNGTVPLLVIRIIASAVIVFLLIRYRAKLDTLLGISMTMIFSGAIGNVIDQLVFGYVRDMLEVKFVRFAVFNVADSFICVGAALVLLDLLFFKGRTLFDDQK